MREQGRHTGDEHTMETLQEDRATADGALAGEERLPNDMPDLPREASPPDQGTDDDSFAMDRQHRKTAMVRLGPWVHDVGRELLDVGWGDELKDKWPPDEYQTFYDEFDLYIDIVEWVEEDLSDRDDGIEWAVEVVEELEEHHVIDGPDPDGEINRCLNRHIYNQIEIIAERELRWYSRQPRPEDGCWFCMDSNGDLKRWTWFDRVHPDISPQAWTASGPTIITYADECPQGPPPDHQIVSSANEPTEGEMT